MYSQCPSCKAIFRITAAHLSARHGLARCGECHEVFNASWNLVDSMPVPDAAVATEHRRPAGDESYVSEGTPVTVAPAPAHAGGEQVELFTSESDACRPQRAERTLSHKKSRGAGVAAGPFPSAMPFSIITGDDAGAHGGTDHLLGDTVDGGITSGLDRDHDDPDAVTAGAEIPPDAEPDEEAGAGTALATAEEETPSAIVDHSGAGPEPADAGRSLVADAGSTTTERPAKASATRVSVDASAAGATPDGSVADDSDATLDTDIASLASGEARVPESDTPPALQEEFRTETGDDRAGPSLAALFAAAEEPLPTEEEVTASGGAADGGAVVRDLFPRADEAPDRVQNEEPALAEDVAEPVVPGPTADGEVGRTVEAARRKTPFDTPDAEEIVIEAPPTLWNAFKEETVEDGAGVSSAGRGAGFVDQVESLDADEHAVDEAGHQPQDAEPAVAGAGSGGGAASHVATPTWGTKLRQRKDIKLVQIARPQPLKSVAWILAAALLGAAVLWQVKAYYLGSLSQAAAMRPYLVTLCNVLSCEVPPRRAFSLIDLVGTSVNTHPDTPGALRVSVNLVNRADFEQSYPPLEITLSDKNGRVVGRRTYLPEQYLSDPASLLVPKVIQEVDLDLAQPSENAVGYEIQLVSR